MSAPVGQLIEIRDIVTMDRLDSLIKIPCFSCLLQDKNKVSPHNCNPIECDLLDKWLFDVAQVKSTPIASFCPRCHSTKIVKNGFYRHKTVKRQLYKCKACGTKFRRTNALPTFRTPLKIMKFAFALDEQGYSTRKISSRIEEKFAHKVSHVAILKWLKNEEIRMVVQNSRLLRTE